MVVLVVAVVEVNVVVHAVTADSVVVVVAIVAAAVAAAVAIGVFSAAVYVPVAAVAVVLTDVGRITYILPCQCHYRQSHAVMVGCSENVVSIAAVVI